MRRGLLILFFNLIFSRDRTLKNRSPFQLQQTIALSKNDHPLQPSKNDRILTLPTNDRTSPMTNDRTLTPSTKTIALLTSPQHNRILQPTKNDRPSSSQKAIALIPI